LKRSIEDLGVIFNDYLMNISKRERYHIHRYEEEFQAKRLRELRAGIKESNAAINTSNLEVDTTSNVAEKTEGGNPALVRPPSKSRPASVAPPRPEDLSGSSSESEDEEHDEFFEAIEASAIAVEPMTVTKPLVSKLALLEFDIETLKEGCEIVAKLLKWPLPLEFLPVMVP